MLQPCLNLFLIIFSIFPFVLAKSDPLASALFVLGDSAVDNGNNNCLPTLARADYAPYGHDFPGQVVLGRFTNGRTCADFIAEYLGLPYPPSYTSLMGPNWLNLSNPPLPNANFFEQRSFRGYNYASAAAGILPVSGTNRGLHYTFDQQIDMFNQTVKSQIFKDLSEHLSKSIFFICIGANDYLNNYFLPTSPYNEIYDRAQFAQHLIDVLSQQLRRLYNLGARKIVMTELGPIGCAPGGARATTFTPKGKCDDDANNMLLVFNRQLSFLLSDLTYKLEGSHFILAHTYSFAHEAIANPTKYGFSDSINPCCKTWLNGTTLCIPEQTPCSNPNDYFFWDGCHPTEAVNSLVAKEFFYGSFCSPMNLMQLAQV